MSFRFSKGIFACMACTLLFAGSALAQGGELVGADWGVPRAHVDVTARVRTYIHDGMLQLQVTRFNLGIDPAPHQNKTLTLRIRHRDGDVKEYSYPERSTVELELGRDDRGDRGEWREEHGEHEHGGPHHANYDRPERGLQILRAYYGAGEQFVDVTEAVRSRMDAGHLYLRVDNYSMGGDPLPGVHKYLRVTYALDGDVRNVVVDEKTDLQLP